MGVGGHHHAPAALPPGKTRYPLYRRLGGPQGRSGWVLKISPPTGIPSPDRPARSKSLYRLSYRGPFYFSGNNNNNNNNSVIPQKGNSVNQQKISLEEHYRRQGCKKFVMLTLDNSNITPYTDCTDTVLLRYVQRPGVGWRI